MNKKVTVAVPCEAHIYGYGICGKVEAVDGTHISYEIGASCD